MSNCLSVRRTVHRVAAAGASILFVLLTGGTANAQQGPAVQAYDVAAYYWPAYHDEPRARRFFPEGIGEWQTLRKARPKFPGHDQPRIPLWSYEDGADPVVMAKKIDAAADNGVNVFIFDWYWYEGQPFLEKTLDEGFLKARNDGRMKFYLMWANHDATTLWDLKRSGIREVIWPGAVDRHTFDSIADYVIQHYFKRASYYKINGCPVFAIYDLRNLFGGLGGPAKAREALAHFEQKVRQAGFPGLHLQAILRARTPGLDAATRGRMTRSQMLEWLGFDSVTNYTWAHLVRPKGDYVAWAEAATSQWEKWAKEFDIPYFPHVSIGWDNNPRFVALKENIITGSTPVSFAAYLYKATRYLRARHQPKLITVNAWNEWCEGSYLEPDMRHGFGYLRAVRGVIRGDWDYQ